MLILNKMLYELGRNAQKNQETSEEMIQQSFNIYEQLETLERPQIMTYIILFFVIFFVFFYVKVSMEFLLAFSIMVVIIYYYIQKDFTINSRFIKKKNDQLKFIESIFYLDENTNYENFDESSYFNIYPDIFENYLHLDPLIVQFFYQNREFSQNNISAYRSTLLHTNLLLRVEKDLKIGIKDPGQVLELSCEVYQKTLNHFHSCIFSLVSARAENSRFTDQLHLLEKLLYKHLKNIFEICEDYFNRHDITIHSKPDSSVYLFNKYDPKRNEYFEYF